MERLARRWRWILLAIGFSFSLAATLLGLQYGLEKAEVATPPIQADGVAGVWPLRDRIARAAREGVAHNILMLGDSMLMQGRLMKPQQTIPSHLAAELRGRLGPRARIAVHRFATPGSGYSTFYFLADHLLATGADQVVIEFNPTVFSSNWRLQWARTDQAAWLGARRLPEALGLPLHRLGLTTDRMLWTVACVAIGCEGSWGWVQRQQQRVVALYQLAQEGFAELVNWPALERFRQERKRHYLARDLLIASPSRRSGDGYLTHFRAAFSGVDRDDVAIVLMAATVRHFQRAGVRTLVYVTPINVEHMKSVGVYDQEGIERSLSKLEASVREAGGDFVDLHDLLPDAAFRDASGHLTFEGEPNGSELLARRLAPRVISAMKTAPRLHD